MPLSAGRYKQKEENTMAMQTDAALRRSVIYEVYVFQTQYQHKDNFALTYQLCVFLASCNHQ